MIRSSLLPLIKRLKRVLRYFTQPLNAWVITIMATLLLAFTEPLIPGLLQPLLDKGFKHGELAPWLIPVVVVGLFTLRGASAFVAQVALARVANHGLLKLRIAMFDTLLRSTPGLYRAQSSSALANSLVYEVQNGANLMVNSLLTLARDSLTLVALTGYLLFLNWKLCLIVAILLPTVSWIMKVISGRLYGLVKRNQLAIDELAYAVEENVLAWREIRLQGAQAQQSSRFKELGKMLDRIAMKSTTAAGVMTPLTQILASVALSIVISIALFQSGAEETSVGSFAAFITAMLMLIAPIKHLSEVANPITRGLAALERGIDLIDGTPTESSGPFKTAKTQGRIRFKNASVRYEGSPAPALDQVHLEIQPGESVALVGGSGAGKTTLANLLPRFIDLTEGELAIDDVPIQAWDIVCLRAQISMVSQNVVVMNDTLANNVALGQPLEKQRVLDCLHAAHLKEFVDSLPNGIDSMVGHNASQLSGGQRQRLAIARAMYKDAPILILDEATSALDNESERAVQMALSELQKNRTTIVIAHRLSTIQHADRILVMKAGKIVESGRHQELLDKNGVYAALFRLGDVDTDNSSSAAAQN